MQDEYQNLKRHFINNELLCKKVLTVFSLISNKSRFRILCLLNEGDFCVREIVDIIQAGDMSFVSQQLKYFVLAGFLTRRKDGKKVIYHLRDRKIKALLGFLKQQYVGEEGGKGGEHQ